MREHPSPPSNTHLIACTLPFACPQPFVSAYSHVGGLLCGSLPALLILPSLGSERWEAALPIFGGSGLLIYFAVLLTWLYTSLLLPGLLAVRCPAS